MVTVTRINGKELVINAELIEFVESTPDTLITTTTGKKLMVRETAQEVLERVLAYRRLIFPFKQMQEMTDEDIRAWVDSFRVRAS